VTDHFAADALGRDIDTFTEVGTYVFGVTHRTGWIGDVIVSDWLKGALGEAGLVAEYGWFSFPQVRPEESWVEAGGRGARGLPLWDASATGPDGVTGRLTDDPTHADGAILVLRSAPVAAYGTGAPWGETQASGVVLITGDPEGAMLYRNAERIDEPFGIPVLQVAQRDAAPIEAALAFGGSARLVVQAKRETGTATNIVATLPATASSDGTAVVVMTPKSGWRPCAAERGGGVVIALALALHLATLPIRRREVRFLFTSGHELGHYGFRTLLRKRPALAQDVALWVHLGASIGARLPQQLLVFASDERARARLLVALVAEGAAPFESREPGAVPGGEARELLDCPYVSMAGRHTYFHSDNDTVEKAVDAERVARFGRAFRRLVEPLITGASDPEHLF
jgi:hypothetical protein